MNIKTVWGDPLNAFINSRWKSINRRTSNGSNPDQHNPRLAYYRKRNIKLRMTKSEFIEWIYSNRVLISSLSAPSIDRVDSDGHYEIKNLRIIELHANRNNGTLTTKKRAAERRLGLRKCCSICGVEFVIGPIERPNAFHKRRTCGDTCRPKQSALTKSSAQT